jgi:uncharacterized phage-associated protein
MSQTAATPHKKLAHVTPANVHDVVAYILSKEGKVSTWKLQKLVYYSQAWSLVWDDAPLFPEKIYAWGNGPVVTELYKYHQKYFSVSSWRRGKRSNLTRIQKETIDEILDSYGPISSWHLSELVHQETPYKAARANLSIDVRGEREITLTAMQEYYQALASDDSKPCVKDMVWGE